MPLVVAGWAYSIRAALYFLPVAKKMLLNVQPAFQLYFFIASVSRAYHIALYIQYVLYFVISVSQRFLR